MLHLHKMSDDQILATRICDLPISEDSRALKLLRRQLYAEIAATGLQHFRPRVYLGDEWFSPTGVPAIAVPFYLAHPRLKRLEKKFHDEIESQELVMRFIRHEAGHGFDHAYQFSRTEAWRRLFGNPRRKYSPHAYSVVEGSRDFVQHLDKNYAQSHPDEDFAETFAVWLDPNSDWRRAYRNWPLALAKLNFVNDLAREVAAELPVVRGGRLVGNALALRSRLGDYYDRRRRREAS